MTFDVRPVEPRWDFSALAAFHNANDWDFRHEPLTAAQLHGWERISVPGIVRRWFVATGPDGMLVGSVLVRHDSSLPDGRFSLTVLVHPTYRQRGIGSALYQTAVRCARHHGATSLETAVVDNDATSVRFAERRGFIQQWHRFKSTLSIASFDDTQFATLQRRMDALQVDICSYADMGDTQLHRRTLYDLQCDREREEPSSDGTCMAYSEFERRTFDTADYPPQALMLAIRNDRWIGLTRLRRHPGSTTARHELTYVARAWRGRGIAQALTIRAISIARRRGVTTLIASNDSPDAAMIAIGQKLGYHPDIGTVGYRYSFNQVDPESSRV